jgi:hypothetical protein
MKPSLSAEQEAQARALAEAIAEAAHEPFLEIARTLVGSDPAALFGTTEFQIRDRVLRVAATAYEQHLAGKKTASRAPA